MVGRPIVNFSRSSAGNTSAILSALIRCRVRVLLLTIDSASSGVLPWKYIDHSTRRTSSLLDEGIVATASSSLSIVVGLIMKICLPRLGRLALVAICRTIFLYKLLLCRNLCFSTSLSGGPKPLGNSSDSPGVKGSVRGGLG